MAIHYSLFTFSVSNNNLPFHFTIFGTAYSCYTIKIFKNEKKNSRRKLENE
jgi:hypothetical protein